jgi:BASS family bile acid:Na+ symporter
MSSQDIFGVVAMFYAVANLASMGLELNLRETIQSLRSVRVVGLTLGWSWVVGPAFAILLTQILPLSEGFAMGLLIFSLAPTAPALPMFIRMARADMSLAAAIMPMAVVGTVILMPLLAPVLIPGLTVRSWEIGKPLLLTVLLPLVIGVLIRIYAPGVAAKIFPTVKKIAGISTLFLLIFTVAFYAREFVAALGSFAVGAQVLFTLGMAAVAYIFGFGLNQPQRGAMALGVCSRNGGAMFVAITAFPVIDPDLLVMILLSVPVPAIVWAFLAKFFASQTATTIEGGAT